MTYKYLYNCWSKKLKLKMDNIYGYYFIITYLLKYINVYTHLKSFTFDIIKY